MKSDNNQIIVYGGTGYYGRKVVQKLIEKGQPVKVVSRNAERAKEVLGDKVDIFQGDVTRPGTIAASLKNVRAVVICLSAMTNKLINGIKAIERDAVLDIMEEAEKQNISRLIYMSGYVMREELLRRLKILDFGEIKIEIESKITQSSFNWTILGDAPAFEIFFAFIKKQKMTVPGGGLKPFPSISAEDVGEITAQAALRDDLNGKRIRLTGPEAISFPEAAERFSSVTGKKIKHMTIPLGVINLVSLLVLPFTPFVRYLYKSLKMLNHFPPDLAAQVPNDHKLLRELFDYQPVTFEMEIKKRLAEDYGHEV